MKQEEVQELLQVINKLLREVKRREIYGSIPRGEFFVMTLIDKYCKKHADHGVSGITVTTLARALEIPSATASRMLRVMERKGYIQRMLDDNDRRVVYIRLTPEGTRIIAEARQTAEKRVYAVVSRLGETEAQEMLRLFKRLLTLFKGRDYLTDKTIYRKEGMKHI